MNAHSSPSLFVELSPLALDNKSLLRELNRHEAPASAAALAAAIQRDKSNVAKSLKALREAALVEAEALVLTPEGLEQVRAIGRAENGRAELPRGWVVRAHAELRPDPAQPRTEFDDAGLDELSASIVTRGLLQNLVISPDGMIRAGERRWRAIGMAIARGEWEPGKGILCQVREGDDIEALIDAMVENVLRENLNPMDEADGYRRMADAGLSAAQIEARIGKPKGKSKRNIQELIQFARELSPEDREAFRTGKLTREKARERVGNKTAKETPILDLSPREALALAEIAQAGVVLPVNATSEPGYTQLYTPPTGGPVARLIDRKLVGYQIRGGIVCVKAMLASTPAGEYLKSLGFVDNPDICVHQLRAKALGGDLQASAQPKDAAGYSWTTPELRAPEPRTEDHPPPPSGEADRRDIGGTEGAHTPARPPSPAAADRPRLTDRQFLILAELAAAISLDGVRNAGGLWGVRPRPDYRDDQDFLALIRQHGMAQVGPGPGGSMLAALTATGLRHFVDHGFPTEDGKVGVTTGDLYDACIAAGEDPEGHGYRTPWLNPPAEPAHAVREEQGVAGDPPPPAAEGDAGTEGPQAVAQDDLTPECVLALGELAHKVEHEPDAHLKHHTRIVGGFSGERRTLQFLGLITLLDTTDGLFAGLTNEGQAWLAQWRAEQADGVPFAKPYGTPWLRTETATPARPSHVSDLGRAALAATAETRALKRMDAALEESERALRKAATKRLDPAEVDRLCALIASARDAARPYVEEVA